MASSFKNLLMTTTTTSWQLVENLSRREEWAFNNVSLVKKWLIIDGL